MLILNANRFLKISSALPLKTSSREDVIWASSSSISKPPLLNSSTSATRDRNLTEKIMNIIRFTIRLSRRDSKSVKGSREVTRA